MAGPERTALYRFYDEIDCLLYVGITNCVPRRLEQHDSDKPWFAEAARVTIEHFPDRDAALAAEKAAIRSEQPRFNVVHNGSLLQEAVPRARSEVSMEPSNGVVVARWNTNPVHKVGFLDRSRHRSFSELLAAAAEFFVVQEQNYAEAPYLIDGVNYRMGVDGVWIFEVSVLEMRVGGSRKLSAAESTHWEVASALGKLMRLEAKLRPEDFDPADIYGG